MFSRSWILPSICLGLLSASPDQLQAQPNPPGTGPNTIQMFQGGSQNVWIAVNPPTTEIDGTPIPNGTAVKLKVYRSTDGGKTFDSPVTIVSGGSGRVGQGAAGSRKKPWIDAKLQVPVDNRAPYMVYLAVASVVAGEEGPPTTDNLTFRYYPSLTRFATPPSDGDDSEDAAPGGSGPLNGTYSADGGSITIQDKGGRVTGSLSADGQVLATLSGKYSKGVYSLNVEIRHEGERFSLPVTVTMRGDKAGTLTASYQGESTTMSFSISGRTIKFDG